MAARCLSNHLQLVFSCRSTSSTPQFGRGSTKVLPRPRRHRPDAWPAIKAGRDVLIAAPTGSGKTMAAFLCAIDNLVRQGLDDGLKDETQVVYVSPLKALSNDIHRNLDQNHKDLQKRRRI